MKILGLFTCAVLLFSWDVSGGSYDIYGNLSKGSRKNLNFECNLLNLLHNVREGGTIIAGYEYGYRGGKLKVWGSDSNGYAYVGSLVYRLMGSFYVVYELQFKHASWKHCTPQFRGGMLSRYYGIVKEENPDRYRQMRPFILKYWYK